MTNSKMKASQVRANLFKLRETWGDKYHVFTDEKLYQLDCAIKDIDQAWPIFYRDRGSVKARLGMAVHHGGGVGGQGNSTVSATNYYTYFFFQVIRMISTTSNQSITKRDRCWLLLLTSLCPLTSLSRECLSWKECRHPSLHPGLACCLPLELPWAPTS